MGRPSKDERLQKVFEEAYAQNGRIQTAMRNERLQCLQDRRFVSISGAQWEGPLGEQFENRPKFEVNKIMLAIIRIINDYRNNRISVDFVPKDGSTNDALADTCDGLYRADEQDSVAEEAYDNAFDEGVSGGFGAWRLRTSYEDEEDDDDERQRIRIEPIYDADSSVWFDLDAKRQDKADAKHCFVIYAKSRQAYEAEYNDDPASWPKMIHQSEFDWLTPDVVYIAEYYKVEEKREKAYIFNDVTGKEATYTDADFEEEGSRQTLEATGWTLKEEKTRKVKRVHKYIMSGGGILEDCGLIAGKCIPIVPFYGKRWYIDNVERCMGQVRLAKDAQRLKNMQLSKLGEIAALSPVRKPIFTPEQIAGHVDMWADDNIVNRAFLLINAITNPSDATQQIAGPVGYTEPPNIPEALAALLQLTEQDMAEILGNQQQADKMVSNISSETVGMIQQRLDMQTFIFMTNMAKSMRRCGEIWLSMAREIYVEDKRKMKAIGAMDEIEQVELMRPIVDQKTGEIIYENDLSRANFDVAVDVGPSFTTRRDATVKMLAGLLQNAQDPTDAKILTAAILMNSDGEGMGDLRDYYRKQLVGMGVVEPTDEERKQMEEAAANQKPDPQAQYLEAAAREADANAENKQAGTVKTLADADLSKAKTVETLAGVPLREAEAARDDALAIADINRKDAKADA